MPAPPRPHGPHKLERRDAIWLLAYPVYQLIGTIRHEGSHALAVLLEGGKVLKFVFWPTWTTRFYWGYVQWSGSTVGWFTSAAPYFADLLTFVVFYLICTRVRVRRHWVWVNLYVIGLASPLVNSGYRFVSSFFREGDLTAVAKAIPLPAVHLYFIATLALYVALLVRMQRRVAPSA